MSDEERPRWSQRTLLAQAAGAVDPVTGAVIPPIHVTTTYERSADYTYPSALSYGRPDNPTIALAEQVMREIECAADAMVFGSGMSAAIALFLALEPGAHIVAPRVMYWGLRNWLMQQAPRFGLSVTFADMTDLPQLSAILQARPPALVWIETPANPTWDITDIAAVAGLAHQVGALLAVDSTCATPVFTRPIAMGADMVMHSATKYLNGHSDVIAGVLACARRTPLWEQVARIRSSQGLILGPLEGFLLVRGLRTLDVRVRAAARAAADLAVRFQAHPAVAEVLYPGLAAHRGHAIAAQQMQGGFGAMLSLRLHGGAEAAIASLAHVRLWRRATSLGGVESLIEHRSTVEGPTSPCPPDLLRLSVGLEDSDDLFADLDMALRFGAAGTAV